MLMDEKKMTNQTSQMNSDLNYDESVIAKIVGKTMTTIQGVLTIEGNAVENLVDRFRDSQDATKGVKVNLDDENKTATVDIHAILEYGRSAPKIFSEAIKEVEAEVKKMTNIRLSSFKMTVADLLTKDEWRKQNEKKDKSKMTKSNSQSTDRSDDSRSESGDTMASPEMMDKRQGSDYQIVD